MHEECVFGRGVKGGGLCCYTMSEEQCFYDQLRHRYATHQLTQCLLTILPATFLLVPKGSPICPAVATLPTGGQVSMLTFSPDMHAHLKCVAWLN